MSFLASMTLMTSCEDPCADVECLNGGTCTDGINSFTCDCVDGFDGDRFGYSVSISGDVAVVGALYEGFSGSAYLNCRLHNLTRNFHHHNF